MRATYSSILAILILSFALGAVAQEPVPKPLSKRFPNIRASLDDGFFTLAEQQARGVLRADPKADEAREAALLLAHALWGQKRYSEMLELLKNYDGEPGFVYWRARAYFELKRHDDALSVLNGAGEPMGESRFAPATARLKGRVERELGDLAAAEKTYQNFATDFPKNRAFTENQFDLAEIYVLQKRVPEAMAVYETLAEGANERASQRARLKHAHLLHTLGAEENFAAARAELTTLATSERTRLAYRIDAYVELAALEEKAGDAEKSHQATRAAIALSPDARQRVPLKMALARALLREGDTAGALKLLEECRTEAPDEKIAAELQLEKAKALSLAQRFEQADNAFQVYLDVADDPDGLADAYLGKGLALWELGRHAEAATVFDKAVKALNDPDRKAEALFKAADSYYEAEMLEDAEKRYRAFVMEYSARDEMPNALYQLGLTLARVGRRTEAMSTFELLETNHAGTPFAEMAALRSADVLWAGQQWEDVLAKYTAIAQTYTNSPSTQALSEHQRGLALYRLGQFIDAQEAFEAVLETYPESEYASQALYMRGFSLHRQGRVSEGVQACQEYVEKFPDSQWTPEVLFWLAEQFFNQGNYAAAEPLFLRIANDFKSHKLAPRALYWAGRAAAAQSNYVQAIERYSQVAKTYEKSEIMPANRFAQGDALTQLGEFAQAILAFDEIIKNYPESYLVNAAWGRKGDCQFSLAAETPARYVEAMNSYQVIFDRPSAPTSLKLHVENKIGECLEKTNLPDKAFSRHMNVVYTFINEQVEHSPYTVMWFTRSAIAAGAIKERERAWVEAVQIYQRIIDANVPAGEWAAERIEKIKKDNWLLFQRLEEADHVGTDG